ncbi:hypothetical protein T3A99_18425 [Pseudomonas sp. N-137]|uniref:hypothetical protein n=1 Tax=Pseudomonas sp. N-137 TaxID=3108452 RepID=UPI002ADEE482|nr:hypothetical protein [Pseudomonas sp. N-137]MEA1030547.1 hypothetical protein [Pseudomonas sp. N-137]
MPIPGIASYRASKQALRAFHHALALEERHGPVNFTILHPTSTQTLMLEQEAQHGASAFAFASEPVTAEFVAQTLFKAIKKNPLKCSCRPNRPARSECWDRPEKNAQSLRHDGRNRQTGATGMASRNFSLSKRPQ